VSWLTFNELVYLPQSSVAAHLRRTLNEANTTYRILNFAKFEQNKSIITHSGRFSTDTDVGCTAVRVHLDVFFLEFRALDRPDFIRRPPTAPFPSLEALFFWKPSG
jgi:hypothetical protein